MTDYFAMKRALIMQSFPPLFLILSIKYFNFNMIYLCKRFLEISVTDPKQVIEFFKSYSAWIDTMHVKEIHGYHVIENHEDYCLVEMFCSSSNNIA